MSPTHAKLSDFSFNLYEALQSSYVTSSVFVRQEQNDHTQKCYMIQRLSCNLVQMKKKGNCGYLWLRVLISFRIRSYLIIVASSYRVTIRCYSDAVSSFSLSQSPPPPPPPPQPTLKPRFMNFSFNNNYFSLTCQQRHQAAMSTDQGWTI